MSATTKKASWVIFCVAVTAFFSSYAWLSSSHYSLSREVSQLARVTQGNVDVQNKWDNGYALDRRIATIEGQMQATLALDKRITEIDDKVVDVQKELGMLGNDVSWIRKYMEGKN